MRGSDLNHKDKVVKKTITAEIKTTCHFLFYFYIIDIHLLQSSQIRKCKKLNKKRGKKPGYNNQLASAISLTRLKKKCYKRSQLFIQATETKVSATDVITIRSKKRKKTPT